MCLIFCGQCHHGLCPLRCVLHKLHTAAVGLGDLLDNVQAQDVGRIRPCFTGLQGVQHRCRVARAIVGHRQFQRVFAQGRRQHDMHAGGVVACSVVQEIFHRAAQQGGIGVQHSLVSIGWQFHRYVAARRQLKKTQHPTTATSSTPSVGSRPAAAAYIRAALL